MPHKEGQAKRRLRKGAVWVSSKKPRNNLCYFVSTRGSWVPDTDTIRRSFGGVMPVVVGRSSRHIPCTCSSRACGAYARPLAFLALAPLAVMLAYLRSDSFLALVLPALVRCPTPGTHCTCPCGGYGSDGGFRPRPVLIEYNPDFGWSLGTQLAFPDPIWGPHMGRNLEHFVGRRVMLYGPQASHFERSHLYWYTNLCSPHHRHQPTVNLFVSPSCRRPRARLRARVPGAAFDAMFIPADHLWLPCPDLWAGQSVSAKQGRES